MILADTVGDSSSGKSVIYYNQYQNMDSISNNLEALVVEFFSKNGDVKNISKTNQILTEAQSSKEAWYFVWQFLKLEKPLDVQYFGANTLFNKLTKQYHEVVKECQEEQIRQQIFETLLQYLNCANYMECNFILSKLISCLSVYVIQTIGTTWPTAIQDTVNVIQPEKFAQLPPTRVIFVLLQILNSVPEEWNVIYVDKNKRSQVRLELEKQAEFVLHIVYKVLSEENISDNITKICLKCLSNWSVNIGAIVLPENHSNSIILALNAMCNENTCHEAVEAITDIYTSPFMEKHPKLVLELIEKLPALEPIILKAIHESKLDLLKDLYLLFISIGESHSRLLLDTLIEQPKYSNAILKLLQIILKCSATPTYYGYDETISNLPFNFWITLLDDIMGSDESKLQTYLTMFGEILHSLIDIFITKLQYPSDEIHEHEWDSDDREKFRIYRQDIGDAFTFCYNILRSSMLKSLMEHFNKAVNQIMISATQNEILSSTRYYEAVLFAFSSIAESIAANESVCVPHIFRSFQELPLERINHPYLLVTIMNFMSACTEWLYYNIDYIAYTISVIELALKSKSRLVIVSATMALKIITPECQVHLHKYAPMIIVLCQEHLNDPSILYKEKARLMYTLGTILSIMPLEVIMQTVDRIVIPIIAQLQSILYTEPSNKTPEVQLHVNGLLQILTNLFGNLDVNLKGTQLEEGDELISKSVAQKSAKNSIKPQPLYLIFEKILPLLGSIVTNYAFDEEIAANICDCIKKTTIILLEDTKPFVGSILQILLHLYQVSKPTCVLQISRQLFNLFHDIPELVNHLQEYFHQICQLTIEEFRKDFHENTHLVQAFYSENASILRKCPVIFTPALDLVSIFDFAILGILLPEKSTIHQCALFISEFLAQGRNNNHFHNVIIERFDSLVKQIFVVIGGSQGSPSHAVDYMADIIMVFNQKYPDNFSRSLDPVIELDNFPTSFADREQKRAFVKSIMSLRNNKRKLKDTIKHFTQLCRGLYGVDTRH